VQPIRRLFRQATWLALVAILALALAPTVSHALAASGPGNPWAEICSDAGGTTPVGVDSGAPGGTATHLGHCPLCGPSAQALSLPSPEAASFSVPAGRDAAVAALPRVPLARPLPWSPPQPGAPPAAA
jgi:Protein of unknown function (DUF2946)